MTHAPIQIECRNAMKKNNLVENIGDMRNNKLAGTIAI